MGAALGGLLRLAPEWLRYVDARNERRHELEMQRLAITAPATAGGEAPIVTAQDIEALKTLYVERAQTRAAKRYPWVDAATALVRPAATAWLLILYSIVRLSELQAGRFSYDVDDISLLSGVLSFWFLSRVWDRRP